MTVIRESRDQTGDPASGPDKRTSAFSSKHKRLNRRRRKALGVGEFARNALAVDLALDEALAPRAARVARRNILDALGGLRMMATGAFCRGVAELVIQAPHGPLDEQHAAVVARKLQAVPGVHSVRTTLHSAAWPDGPGRRRRSSAPRVDPRVRGLLLRHLAPGPDREGTLLVIARP